MSGDAPGSLWQLLPSFLRNRDTKGELRAFVAILERQRRALERDIEQLHDSWFIETCPEWAVPYLGDLLGARGLPEPAAPGTSRRAVVANALRMRRRKGTTQMLSDLAQDVTGWGARAVPFFELVGWTQNANHLRLEAAERDDGRDPVSWTRVGTAALRDRDALDRFGGAFDTMAHTVDVRPPGPRAGWHNLRNLGLFVWRLQSYPIGDLAGDPAARSPVDARRSTPDPARPDCWGYHLSPLGGPMRLFQRPERPTDSADPAWTLPAELRVPAPIRPLAIRRDLERFRRDPSAYRDEYGLGEGATLYYGPGRSVEVLLGTRPVPPEEVVAMDLSSWSRPPAQFPDHSPITLALDVGLGRVTFPLGQDPTVPVGSSHHYGFPAPIGGGTYERRRPTSDPGGLPDSLDDPHADGAQVIDVDPAAAGHPVQAAIDQWAHAAHPHAVVQVRDDRTYAGGLTVRAEDERIVVQALGGRRPLLDGPVDVQGGSGSGTVVLDGLVVAGAVTVKAPLQELVLRHCTLVPGTGLRDDGSPLDPQAASLVVSGSPGLRVRIESSVLGPIQAPGGVEVDLASSILCAPRLPGLPAPLAAVGDLDPQGPGPRLKARATTVLGASRLKRLEASDCLFDGAVEVARLQDGCVRFSSLPPSSATPRRYRCQPDLAIAAAKPGEEADAAARVRPAFTSTAYGHPAFAQLGPRADAALCTGAEDGSEMGAYGSLRQAQREAALRAMARDALPFGLDSAIIHVT